MPQAPAIDENDGFIATCYVQPNSDGDMDPNGLPTMLSTRNEALAALARLPPDAYIHYTVMAPMENNQYMDAATRLEATIQQIEAAKQDVAKFEGAVECLNYIATRSPSCAAIRDSFIARHTERIELLKYMIHFVETIACVPHHQGQ